MYELTDADYVVDAIGMAWADNLTTDDLFNALLLSDGDAAGFNAAVWALARLTAIARHTPKG